MHNIRQYQRLIVLYKLVCFDYQKDKNKEELTDDEMKLVEWTRYKIIVPTKKDKKEIMEAFEHFHNEGYDSDFISCNQLAHEYLNGDNILVSEKVFNMLNKDGKSK
jgi:uncharacterized protein YktA (UPF0223 family)